MHKVAQNSKIIVGRLSYKKGDNLSTILPYNSAGDKVSHTAIGIEANGVVVFSAATTAPINRIGTGGAEMQNIPVAIDKKDGVAYMNVPILCSIDNFYKYYYFEEGEITQGLSFDFLNPKGRVKILKQLFVGLSEGMQNGLLWELKTNWLGKSAGYKESVKSLLNDGAGNTADKISSAILAENKGINFQQLEESFVSAQKLITWLSTAEDFEILKYINEADNISFIKIDLKKF